ncbi:MAG: transposase [Rhodospirillales bacterium]|jgi:transposase InsO family protein|nr:transposase [Rhodospirillales bacterium]
MTRLALAVAATATARLPVKAVADTIGVARPNLVDQLCQPERARRGPLRRAEDDYRAVRSPRHYRRPAGHCERRIAPDGTNATGGRAISVYAVVWLPSGSTASAARRLHGRPQAGPVPDGENEAGADLPAAAHDGAASRPSGLAYLLRDLPVDRPNQVWCADITYIPVRRGFLFAVAVMGWATRKVLA